MKRILFLLILLCSTHAFAATKTLCSSGCDYTTIYDYWVYLSGRSPLSEPEILVVQGSVNGAGNITGIVTSASNYLEIKGDPSCKHSGYYQSGKCELYRGSHDAQVLYVAANHVRISDMIFSSAGTGGQLLVYIETGTDDGNIDVRIDSNIFKHYGDGTATKGLNIGTGGSGTGSVRVTNNIAYGAAEHGIFLDLRNAKTAILYNNTAYGNGTGIGGYLNFGTSNSLYLKNNLSDTNTTDYNFSGTATTDSRLNNLSSDTTGQIVSKDPIYEDEDGKNFHLSNSDEDARETGLNLSADSQYAFSTDIDGDSRTAPWSIGADENTSGGGGGGSDELLLNKPLFKGNLDIIFNRRTN